MKQSVDERVVDGIRKARIAGPNTIAKMKPATIGQTITQAQAEYEAKYARRKTLEQTQTEQPEAVGEAVPSIPIETEGVSTQAAPAEV